jgi:hypothetical protein
MPWGVPAPPPQRVPFPSRAGGKAGRSGGARAIERLATLMYVKSV